MASILSRPQCVKMHTESEKIAQLVTTITFFPAQDVNQSPYSLLKFIFCKSFKPSYRLGTSEYQNLPTTSAKSQQPFYHAFLSTKTWFI